MCCTWTSGTRMMSLLEGFGCCGPWWTWDNRHQMISAPGFGRANQTRMHYGTSYCELQNPYEKGGHLFCHPCCGQPSTCGRNWPWFVKLLREKDLCLRWKFKRKSKTGHHGSCPCGVLGVLASCCRFSRKILFSHSNNKQQTPHRQKYMRRRAALICSYIPLIVGVVLFYAGCDETLKPWCTENRHSGWQGIAVSRWPLVGTPPQSFKCAAVNAWCCGRAGVDAVWSVVQFQGSSESCNVTMPTCSGASPLTLWPTYPRFLHEDGCALDYTRDDIRQARIGFGLLLVPGFLFCCVCGMRKCKARQTVGIHQ